MFQKKTFKELCRTNHYNFKIGDSIVTGLRGYGHIWRNYFKNALNLGISGDRVEIILWRARDISLQNTTSIYTAAQII